MTDKSRTGYWRSPVVPIATLVSVAFVVLALRTLLDPVAVSASFGLPMTSRVETSFVQVYGSRNFVLGLLALGFFVARMSQATVLLFTFAALLPTIDMWIIVSQIGAGPELTRHLVLFVVLLIVAAVLWRRSVHASATGAVAP
jgi:hypothetical protein